MARPDASVASSGVEPPTVETPANQPRALPGYHPRRTTAHCPLSTAHCLVQSHHTGVAVHARRWCTASASRG
jgi:hypothetical protein